jgi:hypothetical protein
LTFTEKAAPTQIGFGYLAVATSPAHKVKLKIVSTGGNDMGYDELSECGRSAHRKSGSTSGK